MSMLTPASTAADIRQSLKTAPSASNFFGRLVGYLNDLMHAAAQMPSAGPAKKQWVLDRLANALDRFLPMLLMPWFLAPFAPVIRRILKRAVLAVATVAIEEIYRRYKPLFKPAPAK